MCIHIHIHVFMNDHKQRVFGGFLGAAVFAPALIYAGTQLHKDRPNEDRRKLAIFVVIIGIIWLLTEIYYLHMNLTRGDPNDGAIGIDDMLVLRYAT